VHIHLPHIHSGNENERDDMYIYFLYFSLIFRFGYTAYMG